MILIHWTLPQGRQYEVGLNEHLYVSLSWVEPNGITRATTITVPIPEGSRVLEAQIENSL